MSYVRYFPRDATTPTPLRDPHRNNVIYLSLSEPKSMTYNTSYEFSTVISASNMGVCDLLFIC